MAVIFHYVYQAVCYLPLLMVMIIVLLYSPALALFPRLSRNPFLFSTVPMISLSLLVIIAFGLFHVGYYQHSVVLSISLIFFIIAVIRQYKYIQKEKFYWKKEDKSLLIMNISLLLPLIAMSGLSAFMWDDALASWNFWAKHYVNQVSPAAISGGYPLVFPYFLSYCYEFLGNIEYQGVVKALLVIIPFTLLNLLAFRSLKKSPSIILYLLIILISIFPGFLDINFYRFYSIGYADPLLAAAVTVSAALLLNYCQEDKDKLLLVLASLTAMMASLVKQPGFLWVFLGVPLIILTKIIKNKKTHWLEISLTIAAMIPAIVWITGPGKHFTHNMGVLNTSLGTTNITFLVLLKTLWHSVLKYWIYQPSLLLLYIASLFCVHNIYQKIFLIGFILPGTILWFIFGAYDMREGLYLLTCCGFLLMQKIPESSLRDLKKIKNFIISLGIIGFIFFSIREQNVKHNGVEDHLYPLEASKSLIYHYFSKGADFVYDHIFKQPDKKIWSDSLYANGIFFGNNKIIIPASSDESIDEVYQEIIQTKPDYVITSGKFHSKASDAIMAIQKMYPYLLEEIPLGNSLYQVRIFRYLHSQ